MGGKSKFELKTPKGTKDCKATFCYPSPAFTRARPFATTATTLPFPLLAPLQVTMPLVFERDMADNMLIPPLFFLL